MKQVPVSPAVRHVRLSAAHAALLFGDRAPRALFRLSNGLDAADRLLTVSIGEGVRAKLEWVRVLLPLVARSVVHVCGADVEALGLSPLGTNVDRSPGCTLSGPCGVVVLAEGVVAAERVLMPTSMFPLRPCLDVQIEGERPRFLPSMPVESGAAALVVVADVSGCFSFGTVATVPAHRP